MEQCTDGDDVMASNELYSSKDGALYKFFFSFRSLSKVRFLRFLAPLNVGSPIRVMKVFDEGELVPHGMGAQYGRYGQPLKLLEPPLALPSCMENYLNDFYLFKILYLCPV
jgi:hypothetical protein